MLYSMHRGCSREAALQLEICEPGDQALSHHCILLPNTQALSVLARRNHSRSSILDLSEQLWSLGPREVGKSICGSNGNPVIDSRRRTPHLLASLISVQLVTCNRLLDYLFTETTLCLLSLAFTHSPGLSSFLMFWGLEIELMI